MLDIVLVEYDPNAPWNPQAGNRQAFEEDSIILAACQLFIEGDLYSGHRV
jgi:hypothetical protein